MDWHHFNVIQYIIYNSFHPILLLSTVIELLLVIIQKKNPFVFTIRKNEFVISKIRNDGHKGHHSEDYTHHNPRHATIRASCIFNKVNKRKEKKGGKRRLKKGERKEGEGKKSNEDRKREKEYTLMLVRCGSSRRRGGGSRRRAILIGWIQRSRIRRRRRRRGSGCSRRETGIYYHKSNNIITIKITNNKVKMNNNSKIRSWEVTFWTRVLIQVFTVATDVQKVVRFWLLAIINQNKQ